MHFYESRVREQSSPESLHRRCDPIAALSKHREHSTSCEFAVGLFNFVYYVYFIARRDRQRRSNQKDPKTNDEICEYCRATMPVFRTLPPGECVNRHLPDPCRSPDRDMDEFRSF